MELKKQLSLGNIKASDVNLLWRLVFCYVVSLTICQLLIIILWTCRIKLCEFKL